MQLKTSRCIINQILKRKTDTLAKNHAKIRTLQRQLNGNHLANELARKRIELGSLKNAHRKLIAYHRKRAKRSNTLPAANYQRSHAKLREHDETVKRLEHDNLLLEEIVEETKGNQGQGTKSKVDGKTYSSSMRMKVYHCGNSLTSITQGSTATSLIVSASSSMVSEKT
ncbi:hypothetical protein SNE40_005099 [Patella caerulea]|uniref:Uncharacterized protein n=1 Tax=Patella caerulea TaxID=87958 RepID=A0AAN8KAB3_PATCE